MKITIEATPEEIAKMLQTIANRIFIPIKVTDQKITYQEVLI